MIFFLNLFFIFWDKTLMLKKVDLFDQKYYITI